MWHVSWVYRMRFAHFFTLWTCDFIASHIHHFKADFTMNWNLKIHRHCWLDEVNNPCLLKDFEFLSVGKIRSPWRIDWFLSNFTIGCNVSSFKNFYRYFLGHNSQLLGLFFWLHLSQWWILTKFHHSLKFCRDFVLEMLLIRVDNSTANWRKLYLEDQTEFLNILFHPKAFHSTFLRNWFIASIIQSTKYHQIF